MYKYFIILCLIIEVRNYSENEQISGRTRRSLESINVNVEQTSLAIIFDCTGSMRDNLEEMKSGAKRIVDAITERPDNPIYNYIFVCFRDPDIEPATVTTDKEVLLDALDKVKIDGGDDCPEMTMGGILEGMKYVLEKSYVYVFTDATSKDYERVDEVLAVIRNKQATVSFFSTADSDLNKNGKSVFEKLAIDSNGEFYDLTKDIGKVMDDFKDTIDKRLITLRYINEPEGKNNTINVIVDSTLEQLFVSVTGKNSVINIFDPNQQLINATNILKLKNLSKVKVNRPNSGQWLILVGASSPHTIKITGTSNITFTFGFSLNIPKTIENTVLNPIKDVDNILIVSPSDSNLITNLTSVNITSSNDSLTLVLKGVTGTMLYATEPFPLPFPVFKIHIFGFDRHEKQLERLISTSMEAKEKSPPLIEIAIKKLIVKEGDDFSIKCHVRSILPISVKWMKNNHELLANEFNQSEGLEYIIRKANESNAGEYICSAANEKGTSFDIVEIFIEPRLLFDEISKLEDKPTLNTERITKAVGKNETFELEIKRFDQLNLICPFENYNSIVWYKNGVVIKKIETIDSINYENESLNINHTRYDDRGEYMCIAENPFGQNNYTYRINIVWPPKILYPSYREITVQLNQELHLTAVVDSNPKSKIMWVKPDHKIVMGNQTHIKNVTIKEQGIYRLIASNEYGHDEKIYYVKIEKTRPKKKAEVETRKLVLVNSDLTLDCDIKGFPDVSYNWFYNGEFVSNNSQYLKKTNVNVGDVGWYKCLATNELGSEEILFSVQVYSLPTIKYINSSTTINDFDELHLECVAKGIPLPFISWHLNYETILAPSNDIYQKYQSGQIGQYLIPMMHGGVGVLTLDRMNEISLKITYSKYIRKTAGIYECRAKNFKGRKEKFVDIRVNSSRIPENIHKIEQVVATEGMRLTLKCPNDRNATLSFLWRKNKKNLDKSNHHVYFTKYGHLEILQANLEHTGIYECVSYKQDYAEKRIYNVSIAIQRTRYHKQNEVAEIGKPPSFVNPENEFFTKSSGAYVHLICNARGDPFPIITWLKMDKSIDELPNYENYEMLDSNKILKIFLNDTASFGKYVCKAENHFDKIEKHFDVSRYEKIIWSNWSQCSSTCGKGKQFRTRNCFKNDVHCKGQSNMEYRDCEIVPCDDDYFGSGSGFGSTYYDYLSEEYNEIENSCGNGYIWKNKNCQDINECNNLKSYCDDRRHICLNTNGSYECIPTPCKPQYTSTRIEKRHSHEVIKDCIKNCFDNNSNCHTKAIAAETIQYSVLSLPKIPKLNEPIKRIVNYDRNGRPLENTEFRLIKSSTNTFFLKKKPNSKAISYLHPTKVLQREKLYKIEMMARSFHYDKNTDDNELLYSTRYYIYIYIM